MARSRFRVGRGSETGRWCTKTSQTRSLFSALVAKSVSSGGSVCAVGSRGAGGRCCGRETGRTSVTATTVSAGCGFSVRDGCFILATLSAAHKTEKGLNYLANSEVAVSRLPRRF